MSILSSPKMRFNSANVGNAIVVITWPVISLGIESRACAGLSYGNMDLLIVMIRLLSVSQAAWRDGETKNQNVKMGSV